MRLRRGFTAVLPGLFALAFARPALADSAQIPSAGQCIAASERAQELKNAGKLSQAREELVTCSRSECPKLVQDDCTKWMAQVLSALPSIIPAAKDDSGHDVIEAKLFVDGKLVTSTFDGKPIAVDPGVHTLRFERPGATGQDERVSVKAGEQNRIISVTLAKAAAPPPPSEPASKRNVPVLPIVVGAAGIVLGGVALFLDLKTTGDAHDLRGSCAPRCAQGDVDDLHTRYTISAIGAGLGVAALAVAGVLYFREKRSEVAMNVMRGRITF